MLLVQRMRKLGWLLLDSFILISLVVLFLMTRHPIHLTWSKLIPPQATLVYSKEEVITSPAIEGISREDHGGFPDQLALNQHWIAWQGSRLAQQVNTKGEHLREDGLFVYSFATQQRKFLEPADSRLRLDNDTLYFTRNNLSYAYKLNTDTQRLLPMLQPASTISNSDYRFWTEAYPDICKKSLTCQEESKYACDKEFFFADRKTQTRRSLGRIGRNTYLSQATDTYLLLYSYVPISSCNIKGSPGTFGVFDLTSGQVWSISEPSWQSVMRFIHLTGNLLVYTFLEGPNPYTRVVQFTPGHTPVTLFYSDRMLVQGVSGGEVLLYTPIPEHKQWPQVGLVARNLKTGWTQTLDELNFIISATGDEQHFAWTTYDGDLYTVPTNLQPAPSSTPHSQPDSPLLTWEAGRLKPVK